jgi:UDP-N-acetylmuramate--alanine ligase
MPLAQQLDRRQPLHFIGVGGIGMSAIAGILADRNFTVSGSDPRDNAVLQDLRRRGVRVFREQSAATIAAIRSGTSLAPRVVVSSAVPADNSELQEARRVGLEILHRSDVLAALIAGQDSVAVAGSHGKTTTSTLVASIVPAFASNGRNGGGRLLVAEADESDGSLVKFQATLGVITNLELDHTDHYPNLDALIATLQRFGKGCGQLLANRDCPILRRHFQASHWWSTSSPDGVAFAAIADELSGDSTLATFHEQGQPVGQFRLPLPGLHNLSNATAAMAVCRLHGVSFAELRQAVEQLQAPGRRFDFRGDWHGRQVVDDYAHHPSEVDATLAMARLMVSSGRSPLPAPPQRLLAVFQPHRYSRTAEFLEAFARALSQADAVLLAPLYSAGEAPIAGISSETLAAAIRCLRPGLTVDVSASLDELADAVAARSQPGDLVLAMGAGDVNGLWSRLQQRHDPNSLPLVA